MDGRWHADKGAYQGDQQALYDTDRDRVVGTDEAGWMTGAPGWWGNAMVDKHFVLKWAHLGRSRNRDPRHREIIEEERRAFDAHVAEIQAEQERKNAELAARKASSSNNMRLTVAPRYANETLVDSDAKVDVHTGIVAAGRLQSLIDSRDYSRDIAELRFQLGKINEAVRSVVPQSMWAQIIRALDEVEQHSEALDVGTDSFDDADDACDPTEFINEDDEF